MTDIIAFSVGLPGTLRESVFVTTESLKFPDVFTFVHKLASDRLQESTASVNLSKNAREKFLKAIAHFAERAAGRR